MENTGFGSQRNEEMPNKQNHVDNEMAATVSVPATAPAPAAESKVEEIKPEDV